MSAESRSPGGEMPFLDHLEELRGRLFWALGALAVGIGIGFWIVTQFNVIDLLIAPLEPYIEGSRLMFLGPADPFFITLKLAVVVGLLLSFPVLVYHVWAFLSPALLDHERRAIVPALYLGLVLFAAGVAMAYFAALPVALKFLLGFQVESLEPMITVGPYFAFVTRLLLAFGAIFELPVVVLILATLGLVTSDFLREKRRHALVLVAIAASLITPGDVVVLTAFMMLPLFLLYELSIWLTRIVERRRARETVNDAAEDRWVEASS